MDAHTPVCRGRRWRTRQRGTRLLESNRLHLFVLFFSSSDQIAEVVLAETLVIINLAE